MKKEKIIIVGGGITGLAAAYILSKTCDNIMVVEGMPKVGGLLATFPVGDTLLEYYYHHFFTHDLEINWMINDLNLKDKLVYRKTQMGMFRDGKIHGFNGIKELLLFKPLSLFGKGMFAFTSLFLGKFADWEKYESIPALDWFYKVGGKNLTDSIWKPLLKIKFGPHASKIPLTWMIGRMRQRMNSRKNNEEYLGYLDGSLNVLLKAMTAQLRQRNVEILTHSKVDELIIEDGTIHGVKSGDQVIKGDKVLLTIPGQPIEHLLRAKYPKLAEQIGVVKYFGAVCVLLELNRKLSDIYWLNIADEGYPFGGIIEHTNFIHQDHYNGKHIVYLSRYFDLTEDIASMNDDEIKALMIPALQKINPEFKDEWIEKVNVFKTTTAAPICDLNFSKKITSCKLPIENLYISNMMHVYPDERSVNNSIRIAAEAVRVMGYDSNFVPRGNSMAGKVGFK